MHKTAETAAHLTGKARFAERFTELKAQGKKGFIPFTLLGWPNKETSKAMLKTMVEAQPACLELGIPFSDPVADGPIIQQAVYQVLDKGFRLDDAFELIAYVRSLDATLPIGLLVYSNTVLSRGYEPFYQQAKEAGADGILLADLPPESAQEALQAADATGLAQIFIVSPLTSPERFATFAKAASGFLYVVSRLGITGTESRYDSNLGNVLQAIRSVTKLPLYVGFGISTPDDVKTILQQGADGTITGSRILQLVQEAGDAWPPALSAYLNAMVAACD